VDIEESTRRYEAAKAESARLRRKMDRQFYIFIVILGALLGIDIVLVFLHFLGV
jgi:NADH:ubiquinone oxidoreductase subunit 3 (subunit A)